jgi:hypothetical protein
LVKVREPQPAAKVTNKLVQMIYFIFASIQKI